ncbi:MAG TPA: glycosyltransferase family 4 protein [Arenibaculum sp.]|nr:glycosyltransferase family 4 protein [Arenibaculum sp.]
MPSPRRPKLIYLVTEDWYFWSHRLPMARAARDAGFDVGVATRVRDHGQRIAAEGFRLHSLDWERRSLNPLAGIAGIRAVTALYRRERPDVVHHVALKPTVVGGLAARIAGVPAVVNGLTGLGYVFSSYDTKAKAIRAVVAPVLRNLLNRPNGVLVLQNTDDRALLTKLGLVDPERVVVIRGSGVDVDRFAPSPEPPTPPVFAAFVGRMLEDKGVHVLAEAVRRVRARGVDLHLRLVGTPDPENPTAVPERLLRDWAAEPGIEWVGHSPDIPGVWAAAHIAVLPSRREGLPKSLLEAAACGRAIVATDVPGCREIAIAGRNAILVPPDDPSALADALAHLARDHELRARFAHESRRLVLSDMAADQVAARMAEVYRRLLAGRTGGAGMPSTAGHP